MNWGKLEGVIIHSPANLLNLKPQKRRATRSMNPPVNWAHQALTLSLQDLICMFTATLTFAYFILFLFYAVLIDV